MRNAPVLQQCYILRQDPAIVHARARLDAYGWYTVDVVHARGDSVALKQTSFRASCEDTLLATLKLLMGGAPEPSALRQFEDAWHGAYNLLAVMEPDVLRAYAGASVTVPRVVRPFSFKGSRRPVA